MKKMTQKIVASLGWLAIAAPAVAATGVREDNSMTLVYLFLGICGMIIFFQLIPVLTLAYAMIRSLFSKKEEKMASAPVKYRS
ncbi:MAG: hypothetical protein C0622_02555 [Desulfuromonas sp.]|nr:MAG: hypothetical protein C0622_02555 [Desulfuromonas sp.]